MKAHFFDMKCLITIDSKIWIVSKDKANIPILKIDKSEFNLIKSGIYKSHESGLNINNKKYWLPSNLLSIIKVKAKKHGYNLNNLAFSLQEFKNKEIIDDLDYKIHYDNIKHIDLEGSSVYIISHEDNKEIYEYSKSKINELFNDNNIEVRNYFHKPKSLYDSKDDLYNETINLMLKYSLGFKIVEGKFIDEKVLNYNDISYYSNDDKNISGLKDINSFFKKLMDRSDEGVKSLIIEELNKKRKTLDINKVTFNKVNIFKNKKVLIKYNNLIKTFESFRNDF